jgi:hypothetical protein
MRVLSVLVAVTAAGMLCPYLGAQETTPSAEPASDTSGRPNGDTEAAPSDRLPALPQELRMDEEARKAREAGDRKNEHLFKTPDDFAPPERVVVGRDPEDFRKPGSLLARAEGGVALVDDNQLIARRLAMYDGNRFRSSLAYPDRPRRVLPEVTASESERAAGALGGAWGKVIIAAGLLALAGFYVLIRRGILDRRNPHARPPRKPKQPRLKVTLTPK